MFRPVALPFAPLDQLLDTKSTDRKMTLLHFIALTVKEKYPDLANFWHELHFVEKAAAGESPGQSPEAMRRRTLGCLSFWLFLQPGALIHRPRGSDSELWKIHPHPLLL